MARRDPHSFADDTHPESVALDLRATVDFASRTLDATATITLRAPSHGPLDLDTRGLDIASVLDQGGRPVSFVLHAADAVLGSRLALTLAPGTTAVTIRYRTSPDASALQWLEPSQTSGARHPFLFSQCQAIHARSVVPVQDTPRLRIRYTAELVVPRGLRAVMAAAHVGREERDDVAIERFEMPQPIPPYLFAFAVGDLACRDLSARSRVWAEPALLEPSAYEFGRVEEMIVAAEQLFGPYDWERFDILTMPPSFPYGGMENPRLTFITPTVLAGDRSLSGVIAHELAHSWTGNLVTNANAQHFWLNEGFTVYAERRILEELDGVEVAALDAALGRRDLDQAIARFASRPGLTHLRPELDGVDPDDAYSQVPYEKGYLFLRLLEDRVGREAFTAWLRRYIAEFRFSAITTDDFEQHFERSHPGVLAAVGAVRWIDGPGVPDDAPAARSRRLDQIESLRGAVPPDDLAHAWSPIEWQLYLESISRPASEELCRTLDDRYGLTRSTNYEILVSWLTLALRSRFTVVLPRVAEVLASVGRMKFLRPLYSALVAEDSTRSFAEQTFAKLRHTYHPISRQLVASILSQE